MSTRAFPAPVNENTGWRLPLTLPDSGARRRAPSVIRITPDAPVSLAGVSSPHPTAAAANTVAYSHLIAQLHPNRRRPVPYPMLPLPSKPPRPTKARDAKVATARGESIGAVRRRSAVDE